MTQPYYAYVMALIRALEKLGIETMVRGELLAGHIERLLQLKADEAGEAEYASWVGPVVGPGTQSDQRIEMNSSPLLPPKKG